MAKIVSVESEPMEIQYATEPRSFTELMNEHIGATVAYAVGRKKGDSKMQNEALQILNANRNEWDMALNFIFGTGGLPDRDYGAEWDPIFAEHISGAKMFIDGTMDGSPKVRNQGLSTLAANKDKVVAFYASIPATAHMAANIESLWEIHLTCTAAYVDSLNEDNLVQFRQDVAACREHGQQLGVLLDYCSGRATITPFNWISTPISGFSVPVPKSPTQILNDLKILTSVMLGSARAPIYGPETRYEYYNPYQTQSGIPGLTMRFSEFPERYKTSMDPRTPIEIRFKNSTKSEKRLRYTIYQRYCRYQTGDRYCDWDNRAHVAVSSKSIVLGPHGTREVDLLMPTPFQPVTNGNVGDIRRLQMILVAVDDQGRESAVQRIIQARKASPII